MNGPDPGLAWHEDLPMMAGGVNVDRGDKGQQNKEHRDDDGTNRKET